MFLQKIRSRDKIKSFYKVIYKFVKKIKGKNKKPDMDGTGFEDLDKTISLAGYAYDAEQDIFYSVMDPWQRKFGYCRLYDEAAAPTGMIIDCEPVCFEYDNKKWLIELWKGQFDMVSGGEVGVYTRGLDLNIPDIFIGTFYNCPNNSDLLKVSYTLNKNGAPLFRRNGRHWWLTGFKLGEFSEPSELTMDINLTLKSLAMRDAFLEALKSIGYSDSEIKINKKTVSFTYGIPRTPQPLTRTKATDWLIQRKNEFLCEKFMELTGGCDNILDKLHALREKDPDMYERAINIGKNRCVPDIYEKIRGFVE